MTLQSIKEYLSNEEKFNRDDEALLNIKEKALFEQVKNELAFLRHQKKVSFQKDPRLYQLTIDLVKISNIVVFKLLILIIRNDQLWLDMLQKKLQ